MRDRWTQKSGALFREREPGKEIQPLMVSSEEKQVQKLESYILPRELLAKKS